MIADLKPYPEYKESGSRWLANVPSHWVIRSLRTLISSRNERNRPDLPLLSVARERGVFVRSLTDADENHNVIPEDLTNYKVARAGDLVINKMKAWQGSMGISPCDGIASPAYFVFAFGIENRAFGQALLRSRPYVAHFGQASDGVRIGQWDLTIAGLRQIPVLVPPTNEQAAIVRFLDWANGRLERAIRAKRKVIALLKEQKQAIIHRAVTRGLDPSARLKPSGVAWLGEVPENWAVHRLKQVAPLHRGYDLPEYNRRPGIYPVVTSAGIVGTHSQFIAHGPGVVTGRYGSTGSVHYIESDFWPHNTSLFVSNFMGNDPRFVYYLLQSLSFEAYSAKSAVPGIDRKDVHEILVPCPGYDEQVTIAATIDSALAQADKKIAALERDVGLLREYRIRLISDVVTGKLDVRGAATTAEADELPRDEALDDDDRESPVAKESFPEDIDE